MRVNGHYDEDGLAAQELPDYRVARYLVIGGCVDCVTFSIIARVLKQAENYSQYHLHVDVRIILQIPVLESILQHFDNLIFVRLHHKVYREQNHGLTPPWICSSTSIF